MKITFLGTRGYIKSKSRKHNRHSCTLIEYKNNCIMIDRGINWAGKTYPTTIDAIFVTHAHPDHCGGLENNDRFPVYATKESWQIMQDLSIAPQLHHIIKPYKKIRIGSITVEAFIQDHSILAPAVGYRIQAGKKTIYYSGDVIYIHKRRGALAQADLYIGDGATIHRPIIRKSKDGELFGHTTLTTQMSWCKKEKVPRALFTHCGTQIVTADGRSLNALMRNLSKKYGVEISLAYDGLTITL